LTLEFRDDHRVWVDDPEGVLGLGLGGGRFETAYRLDTQRGLDGIDLPTIVFTHVIPAESATFAYCVTKGSLTLLRVTSLKRFGPLFTVPDGSELLPGGYLVVERIVLLKAEGAPEEVDPRVPGRPSYLGR